MARGRSRGVLKIPNLNIGQDGSEDSQTLLWGDYLVIVAYFVFVLFVGLWVKYIFNSSNTNFLVSDLFFDALSLHWEKGMIFFMRVKPRGIYTRFSKRKGEEL